MKDIQRIVQELAQESGFNTLVLTDASGFPLAAASDSKEAQAPAAVAALIQRVAGQTREQLGLEAMNEVAMYDASGQRLVCRAFRAGDHELIMAAKIPPQLSYRRVMNRAIREIQKAWKLTRTIKQ